MGCVNSTAHTGITDSYALDALPNQRDLASNARGSTTRSRHQIDSRLDGLNRAPSRTSLREGDRYRTLGPLKGMYDLDRGAAGPDNANRYFDEHERAQYQLHAFNGALFQKDSANPSQFEPLTTGEQAHIFVMDGKGRMYAGSQGDVPKHTSFLAGSPVAAAGTIRAHNGIPTKITDESGHYKPTREHGEQFEQHLQAIGVDTSRARFQRFASTTQQLADEGVERERIYPEGVRIKPY